MNFLNKNEEDLLIRALSFYYSNYVWTEMASEDNEKASNEDYEIRSLASKLGIKNKFPANIQKRW